MKKLRIQSPSHRLLGKRLPKGSMKPEEFLSRVDSICANLKRKSTLTFTSLRELKEQMASECRFYYTMCAMSRRKALDEQTIGDLRKRLLGMRVSIENAIISCLPRLIDQHSLTEAIFSNSFFGVSAKQGISIRYPLCSCRPTSSCGGACYAHDGRDRELHILFRAVLNYYVGQLYEQGGEQERNRVIKMLTPSLTRGVVAAVKDSCLARENGFARAPRIRFAHIGDMAATPEFTNRLAWEIRQRNPSVQCVAYTRREDAELLDSQLLVVNFTVEGNSDPRFVWVPDHSRVVCSAWEGHLLKCAEVNFLEHHVDKSATPIGDGTVCPVTAQHGKIQSCDEAHCDLCFRLPKKNGKNPRHKMNLSRSGAIIYLSIL